ncbi:hypothetical protein ACJJTC_002972 [Scirpophaga incertulas]
MCQLGHFKAQLQVLLLGPSHVVVVVSPLRGGRIEGAIPAHPWGDRETYFYTMFAGRRANSTRSLDLILHLPDEETSVDEKQWEVTEIASVMVAGHWMGDRRSASHEEFLKPLVNAAVTGHDVHVRLYTDEETSVDEKQWEVTEIASVMVAGHWMGDRRSASHEEFLKPLVNAAVTGHDVHVRLYTV